MPAEQGALKDEKITLSLTIPCSGGYYSLYGLLKELYRCIFLLANDLSICGETREPLAVNLLASGNYREKISACFCNSIAKLIYFKVQVIIQKALFNFFNH